MDQTFRRFRQNRVNQTVRDSHAEAQLAAKDFILPFFVVEGTGIDHPLPSLTGVSHLSIDKLIEAARAALKAGVDKVLLFGVVEADEKAPLAPAATKDDALVSRAVAALKKALPALTVMTDICVCAYTDHGHCGVLKGQVIDNDASLPLLAAMAVSHARAGADWVAPSAMMDGQAAALREGLDKTGFSKTKVMGYSAKYASKLYGPFRDAAASAPSFGDRKTYQMDPRNGSEGLDEALADLDEGAHAVMVKPSSWYLDVVHAIRQRVPSVLMAAYHTSGETMMLRHGAAAGLFEWDDALLENLWSIKRAGADWIITYNAVEAAQILEARR